MIEIKISCSIPGCNNETTISADTLLNHRNDLISGLPNIAGYKELMIDKHICQSCIYDQLNKPRGI